MAKPLNGGYMGHKMSKRAYSAIQHGEIPLSMLTNRKLQRAGVFHSLSFIKWLCKKGYIRPTSRHHRGNPPILTRFYHPKRIARQLENLPVERLVGEWKDKRYGREFHCCKTFVATRADIHIRNPGDSDLQYYVRCPHCGKEVAWVKGER